MATAAQPEIILYDLASTKNTCFSPIVWRIRLMLNYKAIAYQTIFLEFPDIEPTLKSLGIPAPPPPTPYTVPAIHHTPSNTYIMDSTAISQFLESTYPRPPLPLHTARGADIEEQARTLLAPAFKTSIMPRELALLSPRSQDYFRRTHEAMLGHALEDLLEPPGKEDEMWEGLESELVRVGRLIKGGGGGGEGGFVEGKEPCYTDFVIAAALRCAWAVERRAFERLVRVEGFGDVYGMCEVWMEREN